MFAIPARPPPSNSCWKRDSPIPAPRWSDGRRTCLPGQGEIRMPESVLTSENLCGFLTNRVNG